MTPHTRSRHQRLRRAAKWAALVLCVLIAAAWVLSHFWFVTRLDMRPGQRLTYLGLTRGAVRATVVLDPTADWRVGQTIKRWDVLRAASPVQMDELWRAMVMYREPPAVSFRSYELTLPLWMPFAVVGAPGAWLWWRGRRRARAGMCVACGYSLAGLPTGAVCPECGESEKAVA